MNHSEGKFTGVNSTELFYQSWCPDAPPRAAIILIHGLGEHSGRYMNVVNHFVPRGYSIYGMDHRGHGRSPGKRAYINRWNEYRDDVHTFVQLVCQQQPNIPIFMLAHSLGALIGLEYVLHYPEGLKGIIASGPQLGKLGLPPLLIAASKVLSVISPDMQLKSGLDAKMISRDPVVVNTYINDPLVHGWGTPRLVTESAIATNWTNAHAGDLKLPLLLIVGGGDKIVLPEGGRNFFQAVTFPDKQKLDYADAYHETHNDIIYPQVVADMERWLEAHMK